MLSPESGSPTSEAKKRLACPDFPVHCYICAAEAADFLPQSELLSKPFSASLAIDECDAPLSANRIRKAPQCEQRKSVKDTLLDENRPTQHECRRITEEVYGTMLVSLERGNFLSQTR